MRTALDAPTETFDEEERRFVADIRTYGWFRTSVLEDAEGPSFSYTTGLWASAGHPELIAFGLPHETLHEVFWDVFRGLKEGHPVVVGTRTDDIFENVSAYAFPVARKYYAGYLGWSRWFYAGADFPCLQIVWPDTAGVFPWEAGFDPSFGNRQVDLTEHGWDAFVAG